MPMKPGSGQYVWFGTALIVILLTLLAAALLIPVRNQAITAGDTAAGARLAGLGFTRQECVQLVPDARENREAFRSLRNTPVPNGLAPAMHFDPQPPLREITGTDKDQNHVHTSPGIRKPDTEDELAFLPVTHLSELIRSRQITSTELTRLYLRRLKMWGDSLRCVITLMEDRAMEQARRADEDIAQGRYRGPLHGIPWGAKDLLSVKGVRTTWGAAPYRDQVIDENATVVQKLDEAGAVLAAKLSMGALAWGDVWFGGKTRNPWDPDQGSSGSSAGSASAVAAGLVGFAIGTETWGSIISPSTRCGVTGLRPTFGRVSRYGAMALSWSMDKIGPICRSAEDCALVLEAIAGPDGKDRTVRDLPFVWNSRMPLKSIRVGYVPSLFETDYADRERDLASLDILRDLGIELIPLELPDMDAGPLSLILNVEAAAAFDELTRSGKDDLLTRQGRNAWPHVFRQARLIPAVEYVQANRLRTRLMEDMARTLEPIDVYVAPSFGGQNLLVTNLTGHPAVTVPNGFDDTGHPAGISFIGNLFREARLLRVAHAFQQATSYHRIHPDLEARFHSRKKESAPS